MVSPCLKNKGSAVRFCLWPQMIINKLKNSKSNYLKREYIYRRNSKKLKIYFNGSHKVSRNYSQMLQDIFVLTLYNGKEEGTYVEIGSYLPIDINNTYLLENQFNWRGISYDINNEFVNEFNEVRKNKCILKDATKANFKSDFIEANLPNNIDFLQIDIEPAEKSLSCLENIPFDEYKFGIITFETEFYQEGSKYETPSRKYLKEKGYKLVVERVGRLGKYYEDWYVHESLQEKFIEIFGNKKLFQIDAKKLLFSNYKNSKFKLFFGIIYNLFIVKKNIYR